MTEPMESEQLKRQVYWHALPVGWEQLDYATFVERRRSLIASVVKDGFATLWTDTGGTHTADPLDDLLGAGESQTLEYKSTARWNIHTKTHDRKMEHVALKTVCGLLNAEGGHLLIGVADDGNVVGLEDDYATLGKSNRDGFELFLRQMLDTNLSIATAGVVKVTFGARSGGDVCTVAVAASGKPVFAKPLGGGSAPTEFWLRVGNQTKQLYGDDMIEYRDQHWG